VNFASKGTNKSIEKASGSPRESQAITHFHVS
jgi:hypothetical protein